MEKNAKKIIVLAGPSGVGKSTIAKMLLSDFDFFAFSISATTREPRLQEEHGKDYYFFSEEEFKQGIKENKFVEWEEVYPGRFYGTLVSEIDRIGNAGKIAIFDIDVLGALNIKKQFADQASIVFVKPETTTALRQRLIDRGSETKDQIQTRIDRFEKELSYEDQFDAVVINETGKIDQTRENIIRFVNEHIKNTA